MPRRAPSGPGRLLWLVAAAAAAAVVAGAAAESEGQLECLGCLGGCKVLETTVGGLPQ
jgi:hypothetical protein